MRSQRRRQQPPPPIHGGYLQSSSCSFHDEIFCREELHDGVGGLLGSHNFRKLGSSHARKNGCHQEEKDLRGRWKRRKHVSDVYDDVELPYPDAKVAGRLCVGGPCKYVLKEGSGVTDNFLLENVVRSTRTRYSDDVAKVLGKALLWLIFSPDGDYLPQALQDRVNTTIMLYYLLVRTL